MIDPANDSARAYRLDRFTVPLAARTEFLARVADTHALLKIQPGFIQDFLLEQPLTDETFQLVTLVEWQSQEFILRAREAVGEMHRRTGFDPQETLQRLGIKAEFGNYRPIAN